MRETATVTASENRHDISDWAFAHGLGSRKSMLANGLRYLRVGGRRQRRFAGTNLKPRKRLENAASPTRRVHAVLAAVITIAVLVFMISLLCTLNLSRNPTFRETAIYA